MSTAIAAEADVSVSSRRIANEYRKFAVAQGLYNTMDEVAFPVSVEHLHQFAQHLVCTIFSRFLLVDG